MCVRRLPRGERSKRRGRSEVRKSYVVNDGDVAAGLFQEQLDDLGAAVLAGAHQCRGSLVVLHVDVGAALQQRPHHLQPPVADRQHQRRLARLQRSG